jgi:hypothetical protein
MRDPRHGGAVNTPLPSLHRSEAIAPHPRGATTMTKFYSLMLAAMLLAPVAFATLNQAAQMVA